VSFSTATTSMHRAHNNYSFCDSAYGTGAHTQKGLNELTSLQLQQMTSLHFNSFVIN